MVAKVRLSLIAGLISETLAKDGFVNMLRGPKTKEETDVSGATVHLPVFFPPGSLQPAMPPVGAEPAGGVV